MSASEHETDEPAGGNDEHERMIGGDASGMEPEAAGDAFLLVAIRTVGDPQVIRDHCVALLENFGGASAGPAAHIMCLPPEDVTGSQRVFLAHLMTLGEPDTFHTLDPLHEEIE